MVLTHMALLVVVWVSSLDDGLKYSPWIVQWLIEDSSGCLRIGLWYPDVMVPRLDEMSLPLSQLLSSLSSLANGRAG